MPIIDGVHPVAPGQARGAVVATRKCAGSYPAVVFLAGHRCSYRVRAGRTVNGPVLLGLQVESLDDGPITSEDLHAIPARRLAAAAVQMGCVHPGDDELQPRSTPPAGTDDGSPPGWSDEETLELFVRSWGGGRSGTPDEPEPRRAGRPPVYGPEHYAQVAEVATQARAAGMSARRAIAKRWTVAPSTADTWMAKARGLNLLERREGARPQPGSGADRPSATMPHDAAEG